MLNMDNNGILGQIRVDKTKLKQMISSNLISLLVNFLCELGANNDQIASEKKWPKVILGEGENGLNSSKDHTFRRRRHDVF